MNIRIMTIKDDENEIVGMIMAGNDEKVEQMVMGIENVYRE